MKVLIAGQAKTGTTALLFALKLALGIEHVVSEPERLGFEDKYDDLIVKYFDRGRDREHIHKYDKIVIVVRNGYDTLISQALFQPRAHLHRKPDREVRRYVRKVAAVREGRAGLLELTDCFQAMTGIDLVNAVAARENHLISLAALTAGKSVVLKYEDFVGGKLSDVERYFGTAITPARDLTLPANLSYVSRAGRAENWQGWLSEGDMDALEPRFAAFHDVFGYRFDRQLLRTVKIDRSEGEDYVWRTISQRRRRSGRLWRVRLAYKRMRRSVGAR